MRSPNSATRTTPNEAATTWRGVRGPESLAAFSSASSAASVGLDRRSSIAPMRKSTGGDQLNGDARERCYETPCRAGDHDMDGEGGADPQQDGKGPVAGAENQGSHGRLVGKLPDENDAVDG